MKSFSFFVAGTPVGQGNIAHGRGHGYHREGERLKGWRVAIGYEARAAGAVGVPDGVSRFSVSLVFYLKGPPKKRGEDIDKLERAVLDALAGVVYVDDSQVDLLTAGKVFAGERSQGMAVVIRPSRNARGQRGHAPFVRDSDETARQRIPPAQKQPARGEET